MIHINHWLAPIHLYNKFKRNTIRWKKKTQLFGDTNRKIKEVTQQLEQAHHQQLEEDHSKNIHHNLLTLEKENQKLLKQKEIY